MYSDFRPKQHRKLKSSDIICGVHPVLEAINNGKMFDRILLRRRESCGTSREIEKLCAIHNIPIQFVPIEKLNQLTSAAHQGVVGFISLVEYHPLEELVNSGFETGKNPLFIILDGVTDVRNFGAIARSAVCFGVNALIFPSKGSAQINSETIKTSAGSLTFLPLCRVDHLQKSLEYMKNSGILLVGASEKSTKPLSEVNLNCPLGIVFGSEHSGITPEVAKMLDDTASIPITPKISSLNVSVAASIFLYEAFKYR